MFNKIIECVPNFSEGRNKKTIAMIAQSINNTSGVKLLDYSYDTDHNRSVYTFAGEPEGVLRAALSASTVAAERIDLRLHKGTHPRMGAIDVVPLIPISGTTYIECISLSKKLAEEMSEKLNLPVYLYSKSATAPNRVELSNIRKGEYEGFFEKIKKAEWKPDYGPSTVNEKIGVTAVGVRKPLIAFNVNLSTNDVAIAKKIARSVRFINGGLRYVKALGMKLDDRDIVQVSMNLTDYEKTPIYKAFELVRLEAERYGVEVTGTELIGLMPLKALTDTAGFYLRNEGISEKSIIETHLY